MNDSHTTPAPWAEIDALLADAEGYEGTANAAVDALVKTFDYAADQLGLTGFQASWALLTAYCRSLSIDGPVIVLRGENLLYPQYDLPADLRRWMKDAEPWLAEQAQAKLDKAGDGMVAPAVREHWRKLAAKRLKVVES